MSIPMNRLPVRFAYRCVKPYPLQFHSHNEYEVFYFHRGRCTFIIGGLIHTLQPGDMILMDGMTLHSSNSDPNNYVRTNMHFDPSYLRSMLNDSIFTSAFETIGKLRNHIIHLEGEAREEVEQHLAKMNKLFQRSDTISYRRFLLALLDMLYDIQLLCLAPDQEQPSMTEKDLHVQRMITYLEAHYTEDLHMEQLENELYLNKSYLAKLFKEKTGMTIFIYVKKRRMNQAKILFMMDKSVTVSDVCYEVGYKHLSHFSRLFKKEFGCTPEQFHRNVHHATPRKSTLRL
ncbi:helix-turn-helix transcriptional regulator [Paenibacillus oceani]|uniref:Helix-turn-helix transcriptional regulator n=1 Tax=Paenibacillus oceani TaxID=2772510 RepID=A0A927CHL0_9BACL|nr:AraC family transcriptional regulator [Paenibacillus oceani]MBD2866081.1 helix-turn-helix transcriptional regulator [Paenibacillus oceani]